MGLNVRRMENAGPMGKMLKAIAYGFYDIKTSIRDIQYLLDIDECPDEFLQYLGRYLGWTFFGDDPDQWRDQLKQAIFLYKAKGTRQALANAVNMIIPSGVYNPNDKVYGLQELWESYFPNILYYALKTETSLGKGTETYLEWKRRFTQAMSSSGIPIAANHFNPQEPDVNVRYAVDAALEYLNNRFNYLDIGGIPYKETQFWKGQTIQQPVASGTEQFGFAPGNFAGGDVAGARAGYWYRNARLKIPPFEEPRFYQNAALGPNMDAFCRETSALLSRPFEQGGFGISSTTANSIAAYVLSAVGIKGGDGYAEPGWGANNNFKFFTSSLQLPFNYESILESGDLESMSLFDYWNAKSSEVHSKFHASSIVFSANDFLDIAKTKMGRKGLPTIVNIFRQFAPFHTLNKLFVGSATTDDYYGTRHGTDVPGPGVAWSGIFDLEVVNTIQSDMDQPKFSTYTASAFPGAWGSFGTFSGVGVFPSMWNPKGGRFLPSATLHGKGGTGPQGYFWSGGGPLDASTGTKQLASKRSAGRRRSLKYKYTGWAQNREGLNQPIATDWFGVSGGALQSVYKNQGLHIPGFVPKGFSFSAQDFMDVTGPASGVYSYYITSSTKFFEFEASSFFPARGMPDFTPNASSFNQLRDVFGSQILRALTEVLIRRGRVDNRWSQQFSDTGFTNFKFGRGMTTLYQEYNNKFRRQLQNWIDQNTQIGGDQFAGGFNILSHVFGPILFNHAFNIKGHVQRNLSEKAFAETASRAVSASNPDWSGVVSTEANFENNVYVNTRGKQVELSPGVLQPNARNTYMNTLDIFERPSQMLYSNGTLLSGVEFVSPTVNSIAVWNNKDSSALNLDLISASGVTFLQRNITDDPYRGIRMRLPLNGNVNYSYNGQFKFPPLDEALENMATSAIAGWGLYDKNRTPRVNQLGSITYASTSSIFVPNYSSGIPWVKLNGKGCASGTGVQGVVSGVLGSKAHASLVTTTNTQSRTTPTNLRPLIPGQTYKLSLELSGAPTANFSRITYALINQTKGQVWVEPLDKWRTQQGALIDNYANVMVSAFSGTPSQAGKEWKTFTGDIVTSSIFEKDDAYQLWITPANRTAGNTVKYNIKNVQVEARDAAETSHITAGAVGNKLFKDEEYKLGVTARVARVPFTTGTKDEILYVRVVTDQKPFVGNGWESFAKNWFYNWEKKYWEDVAEKGLKSQWMPLYLSATNADGSAKIDPTRFELQFNTKNNRTPLQYFSLSKDGPLNGYFASAGPVHNDETSYYIEIAKPHNTGEFNGATLLGVDMENIRYNVYAGDYTEKDFADVFDFFDTLSNNKSSRDARDSSGTYLLSGGGRSEGLEYWGGSHSATNGVYGFYEND